MAYVLLTFATQMKFCYTREEKISFHKDTVMGASSCKKLIVVLIGTHLHKLASNI